MRRLLTCLTLALASLSSAASAPAQDVDLEASAIRQLRKATVYRGDGLHHALLLALRDLRDPSMKTLFESLVQAEHWSIQLDAILGLAELDPSGRVDPWLLSRMRSDSDRADAVRVALELGMLHRDGIEKVLAWDELAAVARVVLLAELRRVGGTPDRAALVRLAGNPDPPIAGLASLLLAQMGEKEFLSTFITTIGTLTQADRDAAIEEMANAARRYDLPVAIDALAFRVTGESDAAGPQETVVGMALALDPKRGTELWKRGLGTDAGQSRRVRYGLILLLNAARVAPETFDALLDGASVNGREPDPLLAAMVTAGKSVASGKDAAGALTALYDVGHRRACRWTLSATEDLDTASSRQVYVHVIESLNESNRRDADQFSDALDAAARLVERDPEALRTLLADVDLDAARREAILLGLANTRSAAAGEIAAAIPRRGSGRADTLALVVASRHAEKISADDLRRLGFVAGGGGQVDETLRVQAAWLFLKHGGKLQNALGSLKGSE